MITLRRASLVCLVALTGACSGSCNREAPKQHAEVTVATDTSDESALQFSRDGRAYAEALAKLDAEIAKTEERASAQPRSWLVLEKVATLYLARARLSGSYDDYAAAEDALARGFARAPEGSGPLLTRASLHFTLHRLDAAEADLDAVAKRAIIDDPTRARIEGMRGSLAFERGHDDLAKQHFDASLELDRNASGLARLAQWHWRRGEFEQAEALYREAEGMQDDQALEPRAWSALQLGLMDLDRGQHQQAFEHYRDGAQILGGWWLLEEHIAEIAALLGHREQALRLYSEIISRTGKGEFMDARASLLLTDPDPAAQAEAKQLIAQAEAAFSAELARFPEASYGHALGHYLEFGPPAKALELATANHQLRPGVPAKIALAEAQLGVDDVAGAKATIDEALATSWRSADLSWLAAQIYERSGDAAKAGELRAAALAMNPTLAEP